MDKFDRRQYNIDKQKQQREAVELLATTRVRLDKAELTIAELGAICTTQQDEIDTMKTDIATLKNDTALLRAKAEEYDRLRNDYEVLELQHKEQLALIEELKARLGID